MEEKEYTIKEKAFNKALSDLSILEELLTDRIKDLHDIKGAQGERHTFIYYRKCVIDAVNNLTKNE